ncbi:hypothetical protein DFJ58DRAFT_867346 [Suillus subalutaceus]|uniref:uncharacterized protein n=1 Tax=Suillus subalutaceus TaxID=48586 RepID=UPI001B87D70A|nr:uncharacterized protein DFJ58DRAFT_867346 [Suillus subalutaceus]KAG1835888.1 hypothetical protein DFJ58DRAFT_867346 [Suillus subalutaceus]
MHAAGSVYGDKMLASLLRHTLRSGSAATNTRLRITDIINLVPHSLMEDDEYEGSRIPRMSWIMCNVWSMTHDPKIYKDAELLNPNRHLSLNNYHCVRHEHVMFHSVYCLKHIFFIPDSGGHQVDSARYSSIVRTCECLALGGLGTGHFGHIELPAPYRFKLGRSVICKHVAKLRLLEHSLLDDDEGSRDETISESESRVNLFVMVRLSKASGSEWDHYMDNLVYQDRTDLIQEFTRTTIMKECSNEGCGAFAYTFRKEGFTKIAEYDISIKQKNQHGAFSLKRPDVLFFQQQAVNASKIRSEPLNTMDIDSESDSEPDEEPTYSDEEEELQVTRLLKENGLLRAANGKVKITRGHNERVMAPEEYRAHLHLLVRNCLRFVPLSLADMAPSLP